MASASRRLLHTSRCLVNRVLTRNNETKRAISNHGRLLTPVLTQKQIDQFKIIEEKPRPRTMDMRQGEKVSPVFSKHEFEARLFKLRSYLQEEGLGAVVLTSYHNINYYSGFMFCSFGRHYGLVVTPETSTVVSAGIDGGQPWRRSLGADHNITYTDWHRDNFFWCVQQLVSDVQGKVGLELDHVSVDNMRKFDNAIPHKIVDVGRPTMRMRMVKSAEEIEVIKHGARIADLGGEAVVKAMGEGVPENEIATASTQAMVREIASTFPDVETMDTWTWFQSGINTDGAHNPVTTRPLQRGDIISLNCFPMIAGYYTALERTLFFNSVTDEELRVWQVNCEVHRRGLELMKPGAKCSDIAKELNEIYLQHDLLQYRSFGYGHSFGALCHYYGREAELELREDINTVLEPNMVVSMEPMVMIPEGRPGAGGYREHDILVIHENGAENITKFPYGPEHNIIKA